MQRDHANEQRKRKLVKRDISRGIKRKNDELHDESKGRNNKGDARQSYGTKTERESFAQNDVPLRSDAKFALRKIPAEGIICGSVVTGKIHLLAEVPERNKCSILLEAKMLEIFLNK